MLSPKLRRKLLMKWAQVPGAPAAPGAPASPASPASPGSPASPASPASPTDPKSTTGAKLSLSQPASAMMGSLGIGWPNQIQIINRLVSAVDKVIVAGTKQQFNFSRLFVDQFPSGVESDFSPPDPTGDVIRFAKQIYGQIMNGGTPFRAPLGDPTRGYADMRNRVVTLQNSPYLQKFQQVNPAGPLKNSGAQITELKATLQEFLGSIPLT